MAAALDASPILLIGTAHVVDLAAPIRTVLAGRALDGIAIELDGERAHLLFADGETAGRPAQVPIFARLWSVLQRRLGADLGGGMPGAEMRTAATVARERNLPLFLIDDPVRAMLNRLLTTMPAKERITLLVGSIAALLIPTRFVKAQIDDYADRPEAIVAELREASPTIARVLLDERNEHMADRLSQIRGRGFRRVAVVVGDAHVAGLRAELERRGIPVEALGFSSLRGITAPSSSPS
ncbi:MAG TPA: TraB/GumN family protein [Thermoplasmata archaeon]|nr:TraB/GumN family protein [Thermoplasmata archaeon]